MHLEEKQVIHAARACHPRVVRRHDTARTPFDRLCETDAILPQHKEQLEALRDATNPRQLRQEIYDAIDQIIALPGATPAPAAKASSIRCPTVSYLRERRR